MELFNWIKIYLVSHILLLRFADPRILITIKKLFKLSRYKEYEVEDTKGYDPETQWYIIK